MTISPICSCGATFPYARPPQPRWETAPMSPGTKRRQTGCGVRLRMSISRPADACAWTRRRHTCSRWRSGCTGRARRSRTGLPGGWHAIFWVMKTGFLGTPFLLPVLFDCGMDDAAYRILFRRTPPGWLYELDMGATTFGAVEFPVAGRTSRAGQA